MSFKEAAAKVLSRATRPLSPKEILEIADKNGWIESKGETPEFTVGAVIYSDIKRNGAGSIFQKVGKGKFIMRDKATPEFRKNSFKDAAYQILRENKRPMKFGEIAAIATKRKMIDSSGKTPDATMGAQLYTEVKRNKDSVFLLLGKNLFGLKEWDLDVIHKEIEAEEKRKLNSEIRSSKQRSIVGDPINIEGLIYGPLNENGVIFLFAKLQDKLGIVIENIQAAFPDARGRRKKDKGWEEVWIEFEYKSSNFKQHGHDPKECDMIVCWEHDWSDCPLEVIELKQVIKEKGALLGLAD